MNRRRVLQALWAATLAAALPGRADFDSVKKSGRLRIAVYKNFAPYAYGPGDGLRGIDVELARALAGVLHLDAEIIDFPAGEDMGDDLRNMVWKGHYLGYKPADVMMHVPVDERFAKTQDKVRIFAPYHMESIAIARNVQRVQNIAGSAAVALEVFTREKIGVEGETLADSFLMGVLNGRLRENVTHFTSVAEAVAALKAGALAAVLGTRSEIEAAMRDGAAAETPQGILIEAAQFPELKPKNWALGMAVRAEESTLAEALASALASLHQAGRVAEIFKSYGITHQPV